MPRCTDLPTDCRVLTAMPGRSPRTRPPVLARAHATAIACALALPAAALPCGAAEAAAGAPVDAPLAAANGAEQRGAFPEDDPDIAAVKPSYGPPGDVPESPRMPRLRPTGP